MSEKPLVSFIMGVYNTQNFDDLKHSVDSMLEQTYENIEIIICDDCSTNGTYEFLLSKYKNNKKILILRNEKNFGAGVARNNALSKANGVYIAIQDDDDYSDLRRIEKQVDFLEKHNEYSFVSAGLAKFDKSGLWSKVVLIPEPRKVDFCKYSQHIHAATLFRVDCLRGVDGYRVAKETARAEDYDLFMRIYAKGMSGYNMSEILYYYNYPLGNKRKIKYKYKWNEAKIRAKGFHAMRLPLWSYIFVLRPLVAGLLSEGIKQKIKSFSNKGVNK